MSDEDVSVKFGGETGEFKAAANEVKSDLSGVSSEVEHAAKLFEYLTERMLEVFAIREITEFVDKITEVGEQIERISSMTGLSGETVQTLGFAIEKTGGDAEGAGMMIARLEKNIAEAAGGTGRAYEGFLKLGVSLHDLQTMPIDQLIERIAQGFRNLHDPVERAAIATEVGSRGFAQLLPAILSSADGIEAFHAKLRELNDDLGEQTVQRMSQTHGYIVDLGRAAQGAATEGFLVFKGAIDGVLQDFTYAIVDIGQFIGKLDELRIVVATDLIEAFAKLLEMIRNVGIQATAIAQDIVIRYREMGAILTEVATLNWGQITNVQKEATAQLTANDKRMNDSLAESVKEYGDFKKSALDAAAAVQKLDQVMGESAESAGGSANRTGLGGTTGRTEAEKQFEDDIRQNMKMLEMQDEISRKTLADQQHQWKSLTDAIERPFDTMLQGVLSGTQTWQQAMGKMFDDLAISAVEAIGKIVLEWLLFEAVTMGQGSWSDFMTIEKGGGGVGKILGFQTGTDYVPSTGLYQLHQGEIVIPPAMSEQIRSGSAGVGGGGDNYNITFQIQAIDTQTGAQFLKSNAGVIAQMITTQTRNSNSSLTQAMRG